MKWIVVLPLLLIWGLQSSAQVYKWVDEKGRTHYSESPPEKVKTLPLGGVVSSYQDVEYKDKIVIYTKPTCKYCLAALAYFKKNGIDYTEYDITKSRLAKLKYDRLNATGVPLILLGNKRMQGFSVERFEARFQP